MKGRVFIMLGIAAVVGAASIFAVDLWIEQAANARVEEPRIVEAPEPEVEFNTIVVAKAPLRYGMELTREQLTEIPWPQDSLPQGAFSTIDIAFEGGARVVLSPMEPNEPVLLSKLSGPNGRATLSNRLAPGMRAVTIRTDEIAGVGGFIAPGDRVDVVLTRDAGAIEEVQGNASGASGSTIATEIVVSNAKVLSVGQGADERQTAPQVVNSVTVEVTPEGAQKVALARNIGSLSLSLRSAGEEDVAGGGVTTISAFGGSVGAASENVRALFASEEPEKPKFATVLVTRGSADPESYEVVTPQDVTQQP